MRHQPTHPPGARARPFLGVAGAADQLVGDREQQRPRLLATPACPRARVIAAALAALAVWLVTDPLLGVDLAAPTRPGSEELQSITPAMVAGTSLVAALAGWALLALLERFTARVRTIWTAIALLVALLSLAGPLSILASTTAANALCWPSCTWSSPPCSSPSWQAPHPPPPGQHQPARHAPDERRTQLSG